MSSTRDLIDSFKVIVSTQKCSNKKVLVFMDEIDAEIEGNAALGLLLGPMWDGIFRIEGNASKIDPCVWVFASTKPMDALMKLPKGRDFLSRINGHTINIDHLTEHLRQDAHNEKDEDKRQLLINEHARRNPEIGTELVYQGVSLLNRLFGPVTHVDKKVLELFYNIMPMNGIRSLVIFVSMFTGITKGVVRKINVPDLSKLKEVRTDVESCELSRHICILQRELIAEFDAKHINKESLVSCPRDIFTKSFDLLQD
jgi:hypothetical protein